MENHVTNNEVEVPEGVTIVSQTDLFGTITDVNEALVRISGFSREELMGQPHNIMRHPDVPKAVFKDLWATIQSGKPWVQLVKNRCKNGDHYWVEANVSPVMDKGQVIGFMSVRRRITDEQKRAAENAYKAIDSGKKRISEGYVQGTLPAFCLAKRFNPLMILIIMIMVMSVFGILDALGVVKVHWLIQIGILSVMLMYAFYINHFVQKQISGFDKLLKLASEGDFTPQVDTSGKSWISILASDLKKMQIQMGASYEHNRIQLNKSARLETALDNASTSMMVADRTGKIIFLNQALKTMFERYQKNMASVVDGFDIDLCVGRDTKALMAQSPKLTSVFAGGNTKEEDTLLIGPLNFQVIAQPVINEHGRRIGAVAEWIDMTQQRNIEERLDTVLKLAAKGHIDVSMNNEGLEGFYLYTANNVNDLLKSLNGAIQDMVIVMSGLARGNIKNRVDKELSGALAAMKGATNVSLDNLSSIILHIKEVARFASQAADESAHASNDLSDRTQQAAATLEEINATMQNINDLQSENGLALNDVSGLAHNAMSLNQQARESMDASIEAMDGIKTTSEKIGDIIGLIDGIAFQTNLLALNAAVEAARAGEHGRGFAVVAGEVRNLAGKSAEAAHDIKRLIEEASNRVHQGSQKVQATHEVFSEVDEGVSKISSTLSKVMLSIEDQQRSVGEISSAIGHLDENIQQNAALVEETSASAVSLNDQAQQLNLEVDKFEVDPSLVSHKGGHNYPDINGVRFDDVRQNMRIWRATTQSFLNGIEVPFDERTAVDATACAVAKALDKVVAYNPQVKSLPIWNEMDRLHHQQHEMVHEALEIRKNITENANEEERAELDHFMDRFVSVTNDLDEALGVLEQQIFTNL